MKFFAHFSTCTRVGIVCVLTLFFPRAEAQIDEIHSQRLRYDSVSFGFNASMIAPLSKPFYMVGAEQIEPLPPQPLSSIELSRRGPDISEWTRLASGITAARPKLSYKEFLQFKYDYFMVGIYNETGIGVGPMIEFSVSRNARFWALAPIISRKYDSNMQLGIGFSVDF